MNQIELHKKINELLLKNPIDVGRAEVSDLISINEDARQYFFSQADENWLDWLWKNGFLDVIKEKSKDPTRYRYRTSEINYLVKVSNKAPEKVVDIMLNVSISLNTFNPEVIDQFLRICSNLPAEQLARMVQKISEDKWINLMSDFNRWGFEYEKMLQILVDVKDYKSILVLSKEILAVRTKEEIKKTTNRISIDNPFYFNDLSFTKVFRYLVDVDSDYTEQTFELVTKVMAKIVLLGDNAGSKEVFPIKDMFYLFDIDFFTLDQGKRKHLSHRDSVCELAAVIKILATRLIGERCADADVIRKHYEQYIKPLPKSRAMWRLRLFILSLCPEVFQVELKQFFFRLFEVKNYNELISGTEYQKALRTGFTVLSESDKREYVKLVIEYFIKKDKEDKDEDWHKVYGSRILSMITAHLTEEEKQQVKKLGFKLDSGYEPGPSIGPIRSGSVVSRGPISQEEFGNLSIDEIAKKLRTDWTPEKLSKQNTSDNFLNPLNAEGVGELLRVDISKRIQDYVNSANLFFERDVLDQHFTYSFFRGIEEILRGNKEDISSINWDNLIILCIAIKKSGKKKFSERGKRERDFFDTWLSGWNAVHSVMTDVIQELLTEKDGIINIDFSKYREQLFEIISYLLNYPDPTPEDEKIESAKMKTKSSDSDGYVVSDPHSMAINTVRGRAFQAFVMFVYQDGKKFVKKDKIKISADTKELYEMVLNNENTRAIMFMFGHYIPTFYFRDKVWIQRLLPKIFSSDPAKKFLYTAAWEGYLSNNLYEEIFFNPNIQKLYERGIALTDTKYPKQKHSKEPDESIAAHLALAFMYYKDFGFDHPLFNTFWKNNDSNQHASFVSFLGRSFVSGSNTSIDELLKKESGRKQRLKDLWDWILNNYENPKLFTEFGFWISLGKDIFQSAWLAEHVKMTLIKTKGGLEWDYELTKSIIQLAKESPEDTLVIARLYLFEGGVHGNNLRAPLYIDNEWFEALKILYNNSITKSGTYALIDDLIREGGSAFWGLKKILDDSSF